MTKPIRNPRRFGGGGVLREIESVPAMLNGTLRTAMQEKLGDWTRVFQVLSVVASIAAAAWYLEDRRHAEVARVSGDVEARLEKLDARLDTRIAELTRSVDAVHRRLDRLLEMQVELSARRND